MMRHLELYTTNEDLTGRVSDTRVRTAKRNVALTDGPFTETKELIGSLQHPQPMQPADRGHQ